MGTEQEGDPKNQYANWKAPENYEMTSMDGLHSGTLEIYRRAGEKLGPVRREVRKGPDGKIVSITDQEFETIAEIERVTRRTVADGEGKRIGEKTYKYNEKGDITLQESELSGRGRLVKDITYDKNGDFKGFQDTIYDEQGNVESLIPPPGIRHMAMVIWKRRLFRMIRNAVSIKYALLLPYAKKIALFFLDVIGIYSNWGLLAQIPRKGNFCYVCILINRI